MSRLLRGRRPSGAASNHHGLDSPPCAGPSPSARALLAARPARSPAAAATTSPPPAARSPSRPAQPRTSPRPTARPLERPRRPAPPEGPILAPSVSVLDPGRNRFAFALFDTARKQITGAQVALYTAAPGRQGRRAGPYSARSSRWRSSRSSQSQTTPGTPTRPSRSTSPTCRSAKRPAAVVGARAPRRAHAAHERHSVNVGARRGRRRPRVGRARRSASTRRRWPTSAATCGASTRACRPPGRC